MQSADVQEGSFLFQCISVAVQRLNSVLLHDTLIANLPDLQPSNNFVLASVFNSRRDLYCLGFKNNNNNNRLSVPWPASSVFRLNCQTQP